MTEDGCEKEDNQENMMQAGCGNSAQGSISSFKPQKVGEMIYRVFDVATNDFAALT